MGNSSSDTNNVPANFLFPGFQSANATVGADTLRRIQKGKIVLSKYSTDTSDFNEIMKSLMSPSDSDPRVSSTAPISCIEIIEKIDSDLDLSGSQFYLSPNIGIEKMPTIMMGGKKNIINTSELESVINAQNSSIRSSNEVTSENYYQVSPYKSEHSDSLLDIGTNDIYSNGYSEGGMDYEDELIEFSKSLKSKVNMSSDSNDYLHNK